VKVVRVEPKLAVGMTFRNFRSGFGAIFSGGPRRETLRTDSATYKQELSEEDSYIKIGDPVVEVVGEEFATPGSQPGSLTGRTGSSCGERPSPSKRDRGSHEHRLPEPA
jgi:hypothetical protein